MTERDERQSRLTGSIVTKYVVLQIPTTVLVIMIAIFIDQKLAIPSWLFWCVIVGTILKDVILFPFVWRSYDSRATHPMIGEHGVAVDRLSPEGYVRIQGVLWQARLSEGCGSVGIGEGVRVEKAQGIKLTVKPESAATYSARKPKPNH